MGIVIYIVTVYLKVYETLKFDNAVMLHLLSDTFPVLILYLVNVFRLLSPVLNG